MRRVFRRVAAWRLRRSSDGYGGSFLATIPAESRTGLLTTASEGY